ncbi:MAG: biotin synthase BioB [Succinivibrionaceae bacterium]|nr:biotin synthase BioB [Succinivibrionaceae bacterium]
MAGVFARHGALLERCKALLAGEALSEAEALALGEVPLGELREAVGMVTRACLGNAAELCAITSAKAGQCTEDCKFCAQSAHYATGTVVTALKDPGAMAREAGLCAANGVHRFSIVTAGRRLPRAEVEQVARAVGLIHGRHPGLLLCASLGLLGKGELAMLRDAGLSRYHCNLETSRRMFPLICTTHGYDQKVATLRAAREVGLSLCSGVIFGMGEGAGDRVAVAMELSALGVDSVPVNFLNPIPGTPLGDRLPIGAEEAMRCLALMRLTNPHAAVRLAGGRLLLRDCWKELLDFGANAVITGDMLTTKGLAARSDGREILASGRSLAPLLAPQRRI